MPTPRPTPRPIFSTLDEDRFAGAVGTFPATVVEMDEVMMAGGVVLVEETVLIEEVVLVEEVVLDEVVDEEVDEVVEEVVVTIDELTVMLK